MERCTSRSSCLLTRTRRKPHGAAAPDPAGCRNTEKNMDKTSAKGAFHGMVFGMSVIGLGLVLCVRSPMVIASGAVAVVATFVAALMSQPKVLANRKVTVFRPH